MNSLADSDSQLNQSDSTNFSENAGVPVAVEGQVTFRGMNSLATLADPQLNELQVAENFQAVSTPGSFSGNYEDLVGIPSTFAPSAHTHPESEVVGLVSDLAGKQPLHANLTAISLLVTDSFGLQLLTKGDAGSVRTYIGLGNVDNTSDANKPISTATAAALVLKADLVGGFVPTSQIPAIAITDFLGTVASQAAMLALSGQKGDWTIRSDTGVTWVITGSDPTQLSSWTALSYPAGAVLSVNGQTGIVVLGASDVGAQPVDGDLTAIAALTTTSFGRGFLTQADGPASLTYIGAQPLDADLTSLAAASSTDRIYYRISAGTWGPIHVGAGLNFVSGTLTQANYYDAFAPMLNGPTEDDTVASGATLNLTSLDGPLIQVTGTTPITAITLADGEQRTLRFSGALTLTPGATLITDGGAVLNTVAGGWGIAIGGPGGVVTFTRYQTDTAFAVRSFDNIYMNSGANIDYNTPDSSPYFDVGRDKTGTDGSFIRMIRGFHVVISSNDLSTITPGASALDVSQLTDLRTHSFPDHDGTFATQDGVETLTNKTIVMPSNGSIGGDSRFTIGSTTNSGGGAYIEIFAGTPSLLATVGIKNVFGNGVADLRITALTDIRHFYFPDYSGYFVVVEGDFGVIYDGSLLTAQREYQLPDHDGIFATQGGTETFTNKTINASQLVNASVTLAKLANVATSTIFGRTSLGTGVPEALTPSLVQDLLGLDMTDSTTMLFPATNATIARIDAAQTFTGIQTFAGQIIHRAGTTAANTAPAKFVSGALNTTAEAGAFEFLTDAFYLTITTGAARKSIPLGPSAGPITFAGPTAARIVTLPDAAITVARIDAAQTFTGTQTFSGQVTTAALDVTNGSWHWQVSNFGIGGTWAGFANSASPSLSNYSLLADSGAGTGTYVNAATGGQVGLRINNVSYFVVDATGAVLTGTLSISGDTTHADAKNLILGSTTGTKIGTATSQKLAFHNSSPVIQRVGAAQAAVITTASTNVAPFGFATAAQADAIVTLVNELRAALVEKGLIKGAA